VKKLLFLFILFLSSAPIFSAEKIQIVSNGDLKGFYRIRTYNNIKYLSLKDISDLCEGRINWYNISGKVVLAINGHHITFFCKSKDVIIDTNKFILPFPSYLASSDLYVPIDFFLSIKFSDASGYKINYDESTNTMFFETMVNVFPPRIYTYDAFTKINFDLTEKLAFDLKKTTRGEYMITFFRGKTIPEKLYFENDLVKQVSVSNSKAFSSCLFKLTDPKLEIKTKYEENPLRLSVYIYPKNVSISTIVSVENMTAVEASTVAPVITEKPKQEPVETAEKETPLPDAITSKTEGKTYTIVVDAGHGGDDPGAVGANNTREKNINLAIATEISKLLKDDGYKVIMTRNDDTFIPLVDRTQIANDNNADFFVSIHCNASMKKKLGGFEIFFLSENATDSDASAVAARENAVVQLEGKPTVKKEKLQTLLWSMVMNEYMNESAELCSFITQDVTSRINIENRGIKQAGFYVLRGTQMPAVLVECAFLSNQKEEVRLNTKRFQKDMADSIYSGLKKYISRKNIMTSK